VLEYLRTHGASFFGPLHDAIGGGYPAETVDALWNLAWQGRVTNDTFQALRAFTRVRAARRNARERRPDVSAFRSRRLAPPSAAGRWALVYGAESHAPRGSKTDATKWAAAITQQLLARHGVLTREAVAAESIAGGFGIVYPVLKGMEETGRLRRGYFVAGLGATQFAMPGALDLLRSLRDAPDDPEIAVLAATDPANPYGAALKWPAFAPGGASARKAQPALGGASASQAPPAAPNAAKAGRGPTRSVGATVILVNGALAAYLARGDRQLLTYLPDAEPERSKTAQAIARVLIDRARTGVDSPRGMLLEEIDGAPPALHPMAPFLREEGFVAGALGLQATLRARPAPVAVRPADIGTRPARSSVSSPFARRVFTDDEGGAT
jgi:ATP-dependent Lhr-like helicase